jgi:UDP-glucose 4-epimerase
MANILVTGGAGFIGSHLVDKLLRRGNKVSVIDNLSTGKRKNLNKKAKLYKIDIQSKAIKKIFEKEKPEVVFHLAAQASVVNSVKNPVKDATSNVLGTINLLNNCVKYKVKKIVYSSTGGALYGDPDYLPADERHPVKPLCPYGQSKAVGEQYILLYNRLYGLNYLILRYSNVYGPRQDPLGEAGVIAIFIKKVLENKRPIIFGDGKQTRDFIYVDDVVNANLFLKRGIFNIATEKETSVNHITEMILRGLKSKISPRHDKPREGEVKNIYLDIRKARRQKWKPIIGIDEGIKKTINYFVKCQ